MSSEARSCTGATSQRPSQEGLECLRADIAGFQEAASQEAGRATAAATTHTAAAARGTSTAALGSQTDKQTDVRISLLLALNGYGPGAGGRGGGTGARRAARTSDQLGSNTRRRVWLQQVQEQCARQRVATVCGECHCAPASLAKRRRQYCSSR